MPDKRNTRKELAWGIQVEATRKKRAQKVADEISGSSRDAASAYAAVCKDLMKVDRAEHHHGDARLFSTIVFCNRDTHRN